MKGRQILLDHLGGRQVAALLVDGQLDDLLIEADAPAPGTIYRAVADRPVKGQGGMFVKTSDGPAFLRQVKGLAPGDSLFVQVTGYAEPGKAIPVTLKLLFKSRFAIITPGAAGKNISRQIRDEARRDALQALLHTAEISPDMGVILRSSCETASDAEIEDDLMDMVHLAAQVLDDPGTGAEKLLDGDAPHQMAWREWTEPAEVVTTPGCADTHGLLDMLEDLRDAAAPLPNGASAFIEPTRALVAIDVNTGSDTSMAAGVKANLALAKDLPRLLRVRGLGGQITLDLAPMPKKDRRSFETALRASLRLDPIDTSLAGWTPLGHFELQRKRDRLPLAQVLP